MEWKYILMSEYGPNLGYRGIIKCSHGHCGAVSAVTTTLEVACHEREKAAIGRHFPARGLVGCPGFHSILVSAEWNNSVCIVSIVRCVELARVSASVDSSCKLVLRLSEQATAQVNRCLRNNDHLEHYRGRNWDLVCMPPCTAADPENSIVPPFSVGCKINLSRERHS